MTIHPASQKLLERTSPPARHFWPEIANRFQFVDLLGSERCGTAVQVVLPFKPPSIECRDVPGSTGSFQPLALAPLRAARSE